MFTPAEALKTIAYLEKVVTHQSFSIGSEVENALAFLHDIKVEYEVEQEWLNHERVEE